MMIEHDRRRQERIRFSWPIWFGCDDGYNELTRGQIIDLSSKYVRFSVLGNNTPAPGQHVMVRFSYPLKNAPSFEMGNYIHWGEVFRVDGIGHVCHVTLRLHKPINLTASPQTAEAELVQSA